MPEVSVSRIFGSELKEIITTQEEVRKLLSALDFRKSAGYDGIPTKLLKITADEIACSLATLFNESFSRGEQPQDWRDATISPLHKKASRAEVTNYRPISLLSVVSKVQERIVHQRLYTHEPHLPADQSGFRSKDSTELQLSCLVHEISASRDSGQAVSACFFDLSKAFDRVWHAGLLAKLEHLGVRGIALTWLTSYLTRRRQRVKVGSALSSWKIGNPFQLEYPRALSWGLFFSWCTRSTSPQHVQTLTPNAASSPMTRHSSRRITRGICQLHSSNVPWTQQDDG